MPNTAHTSSPPRLGALMRQQGWSDRSLGRALGVSGETVRLWRLGVHQPYPKSARRLEAVMRAPLGELFKPENDEATRPPEPAASDH